MESWDVVIVGGGVAALRAAIAASDAGASVMTFHAAAASSAAGGAPTAGIAASLGEPDTRGHIEDTVSASDALCDASVVADRCDSAFEHLAELEQWGLLCRRDAAGAPHLSGALGHRSARLAGCGDVTQRQMVRLLEEQCMKRGIPRKADVLGLRLIADNDQIRGLIVLDVQTGAVAPIQAKTVVLATADHSGIWNGAATASGTGAVLALDAGVSLSGMEFTTWHPLCVADTDLVLPIELLDAGARLRLVSGDDIETGGVGMTELCRTMSDQSCVLDARGVPHGVRVWFQQAADRLSARASLDMWSYVIPLQPRAVHGLGGAPTDGHGRVLLTDRDVWLTGLHAAGGSASSGMHGAEALVGNILLDELAGGAVAGRHAGEWSLNARLGGGELLEASADEMAERLDHLLTADAEGSTVGATEAAMLRVMEQHVGISRDADGLDSALRTITELAGQQMRLTDHSPVMNTELVRSIQLEGLLMLARTTITAASARRESRGAHNRTDHPARNEEANHILVDADGAVADMPCA